MKLQYYRLKADMSQSILAKMLGVTPAAVSKWENGHRKIPVDILLKACKILSVRPEKVMEVEE